MFEGDPSTFARVMDTHVHVDYAVLLADMEHALAAGQDFSVRFDRPPRAHRRATSKLSRSAGHA